LDYVVLAIAINKADLQSLTPTIKLSNKLDKTKNIEIIDMTMGMNLTRIKH